LALFIESPHNWMIAAAMLFVAAVSFGLLANVLLRR
jgi:hypothetical protein